MKHAPLFSLICGALLVCAAPVIAAPSTADIPVYQIDPGHTRVAFRISHLGFSMFPGTFNDISGKVYFNPDEVEQSHVDVKIKAASATMNHPVLDRKLQGDEFFNIARYPTIQFISTEVKKTSGEMGTVTGNLTMLGVTRPVTLKVRFNKKGYNSYAKGDEVGFTAWGKLNRSDFGMKHLLPDVGDEVKFTIAVEAIAGQTDMKPATVALPEGGAGGVGQPQAAFSIKAGPPAGKK